MELIIKWAKQQRKKNELDDMCLSLLLETIIMEISYMLPKLEIKKIRKFFKNFRAYMLLKPNAKALHDHVPNKRDLQTDEETMKKELYRLFNFYIPLLRIIETDMSSNKKFRESELYKKVVKYATSDEMIDSIIDISSANETQDSQCEITFERPEIKEIIKSVIFCEDKSETFKKLENRVIQEIISNANIDEIHIKEEDFKREEAKKPTSLYTSYNKMVQNNQAPTVNLLKQNVLVDENFSPKPNHATYSIHDNDMLSMEDQDINRCISVRSMSKDQESDSSEVMPEEAKEPEIKVPEEFFELQMAAEEDVSHWTKVTENKDVIVFKKKTDGTPLVLIKAIATLEGIPKDIVYDAIFDTNIRQSWDKLFHKFEVVEEDDAHTVLYYVIKAPLGISNRDFLQCRQVVEDWPRKGITYMHFKSIEHPEKPEVKKIVRAETIMSGYVIEQIQDDPPVTRLIVVSQNDVKGLIPKALVNMGASKAPKQWISNLIKGCDDLMKQRAEEQDQP